MRIRLRILARPIISLWRETGIGTTPKPQNLELTPAPLLVEVADDAAAGARTRPRVRRGPERDLSAPRLGWRVTAVDASAAAGSGSLRRKGAGGRYPRRRSGERASSPSSRTRTTSSATSSTCNATSCPQFERGRPGGTLPGAIHLAGAAPHQIRLNPGELRNEFARIENSVLFGSRGGRK